MTLNPALESLRKLKRLPRNPQRHDLGLLHRSYNRFGFLQRVIVNTVTGRMIAGHGRIDALQQRKASGGEPPVNVEVRGGEWLVPVDYVEVPEEQEEAAALALNRLGEGDYDEVILMQVLADLAADVGLDGTGFDEDDLDALLAYASTVSVGGEAVSGLDLGEAVKETWRIAIRCDLEEQVAEVAHYLEVDFEAGKVQYDFADTVLAAK